jgi:O-antigen/teichoic acid export membrane protein
MKLPFFGGELIRSSTLVFVSAISSSLIALLANLVVANLLGYNYFGAFKTIIYLFAFLPMLIDFGINATLTKYVAELKSKEKIGYLIKWFLKIKLLSYVFLIAVLFLVKDYIAFYFLKDASLSYLILAGIFLAASNFFFSFSSIVLGLQNFRIYSLSQFFIASLAPILSVLLYPLGIFYMILGWGFGIIIGNLPNILFLLRKQVFKAQEQFDVKKIFFRFSLPIYPIELTVALVSTIVPLLSLFFSPIIMSYYSFAFMFYFAALLIPNSLSIVLFPKFSELNGLEKHSDAKDILRKSLTYYSIVLIAGLVFVYLFSEWLISFLAIEFLPSLIIFKAIVSLGLVFGYPVIYSNYLKGLGKVTKYAFIVLLQNLLLIIVSFILLTSMAGMLLK